MNKLLGFLIVALSTSTPALAAHGSQTLLCQTEDITIFAELQQYDSPHKTGPALIKVNGHTWNGAWNIMAAPKGTRLTGYYFLNISAKNSTQENLQTNSVLSPEGQISGGWFDMPGVSTSVECHFIN